MNVLDSDTNINKVALLYYTSTKKNKQNASKVARDVSVKPCSQEYFGIQFLFPFFHATFLFLFSSLSFYLATSMFVNSFQTSKETRFFMDLICEFGPSSYNFVLPSLIRFFSVASYNTGETSCFVSMRTIDSLFISDIARRVPRTFMKMGISGFEILIVSRTFLRFSAAESMRDV